MADLAKYLDDPAWSALTGPHAAIALVDGEARRYPPDVTPFAAVGSHDDHALDSLARLVEPGSFVGLFGAPRPLTARWRLAREFPVLQMTCERLVPAPDAGEPTPLLLTSSDVPAMLRLVEVTEPGPFRTRTIELGPYLSLWQDGDLVAMAGVRMRPPGYREISAVCTHPQYQRRGYGRLLVRALVRRIQHDGEVPFLHVAAANHDAIALYESVGFVRRAELTIAVLERL